MGSNHFISLTDYSRDEIWNLLEIANHLKISLNAGQEQHVLKGKTLAMLFQKPSLRTRVSFEVAMQQLGGYSIYLVPADIQLGERETTEDVSLVLSRYCDGIMARVHQHQDLVDLSKYSSIPVVNGLSEREHPCQILGDLLTLWEKRQNLEGLKLAWIGDGNNVLHSWLQAGPKMGISLRLACPKGFEPESEILEYAKQFDADVLLTNDPEEAVSGADILYTDVWASMGKESEAEDRKGAFSGFRITKQLLAQAKPDASVMHCLPAHYKDEIAHDVAHGPQSIVFDQAENRLHAQRAILVKLMR